MTKTINIDFRNFRRITIPLLAAYASVKAVGRATTLIPIDKEAFEDIIREAVQDLVAGFTVTKIKRIHDDANLHQVDLMFTDSPIKNRAMLVKAITERALFTFRNNIVVRGKVNHHEANQLYKVSLIVLDKFSVAGAFNAQ